jgi:hypothetical protein
VSLEAELVFDELHNQVSKVHGIFFELPCWSLYNKHVQESEVAEDVKLEILFRVSSESGHIYLNVMCSSLNHFGISNFKQPIYMSCAEGEGFGPRRGSTLLQCYAVADQALASKTWKVSHPILDHYCRKMESGIIKQSFLVQASYQKVVFRLV